jgi:hypothetical protein
MFSEVVIPGVCRVCGCTEDRPCTVHIVLPNEDRSRPPIEFDEPCGWLDRGQTLCNNPTCVGRVPLGVLETILEVS